MAKGKYQEWLEPDGLLKLEGYARDGLIDEQIAKNMGIALSTLKLWKNGHPAILAALKRGKEVIDIEVENALYKRAIGYTYEEVKEEEMPDGRIRRTVTTKEVAGDTTAQIFWLKNRKSTEWRDRRDVALTGEDGGPVAVELSTSDLIDAAKKVSAKVGAPE